MALVVACLLLALPATVAAHAQLVASSPAHGEELTASPAEVRLIFSEAPDPGSVSVRLFDRRGGEIDLGVPQIDAALPTTVRVTVERELRPGPYTVVWSVVSEEDEHPASREFVFGIEEPAGDPSVTAAEVTGDDGGSAALLARYLTLVGLMVLVGAAVQARWFGLVAIRMAYLASAGAVAVFAGLILDTLAATGQRSPNAEPLSWIDAPLVSGIALVGVAFYAALLAARVTERRARALWLLVLLAGLGLAWVLAAESHAAGVGILVWVGYVWGAIDLAIEQPGLYAAFPYLFEFARQLNIAVAALHVLAMSAWIGGLLAGSVAGLTSEKAVRWHPRFSRFALGAFLVVVATGLYQAALYLPSAEAVVDSEYGLMLLGKHVFVAGLLALAAVSRFVVGPALRRGQGWLRRRAVAVVRAEAAVGAIVIAASVLVAATPPARPPTDVFFAPGIIEEFVQQRQVIAGDRPGWELVVDRQSHNRHEFTLRTPDSPPADALLVLERPGEQQRELGLERDGADLTAAALALTRDGHWRAFAALPNVEVQFSFKVRAGHPLPHYAEARSLWDGAIAQTDRDMRSARMIDVLTDGLSVMLFVHHELVAPDREHLEILGGRETISIGRQRFSRDSAGPWEVRQAGFPFKWPAYSFLDRAIGVRIAGSSTQAGQEVTVLAGYDPEGGIGYEMWVGQQDGLIHRIVMGVPGHYMTNAYYDINAPISIEPPAGR